MGWHRRLWWGIRISFSNHARPGSRSRVTTGLCISSFPSGFRITLISPVCQKAAVELGASPLRYRLYKVDDDGHSHNCEPSAYEHSSRQRRATRNVRSARLHPGTRVGFSLHLLAQREAFNGGSMAGPTINQFLDTLGVRLAVRRPSWDAIDEATDTVVMKLWFHEVEPGSDEKRIRVWTDLPPGKRSDPIGRAERRRSIAHAEAGRPTYAVLRHGKDRLDPEARKYDGEHLRKIGTVERRSNGDVYVTVERLVTVEEFRNRSDVQALEQDLADIARRHGSKPTTREALMAARLGQGKYRADLLALWDNRCAVTGCSVATVLIASHALSWKKSTDDQRLDPNNGLPLVATLDRLFDAGLIAFTGAGTMLVSPALPAEHHVVLGLPGRLRKRPSPEQARYLEFHAEHVFRTKA